MPPRKSSSQPSYSKGGGSRNGRTVTAPKIATSLDIEFFKMNNHIH